MYRSILSSTSAVDGGGWLTSRSCRTTPGNDQLPIGKEAGWDSRPVWTCGEKIATTGIRSRHRPARNKSLYRLTNSQDNKIFRPRSSFVRNVSENLLRHYEVHCFAPSLSSVWVRGSVSNSSDKMTVILTIETLTTIGMK